MYRTPNTIKGLCGMAKKLGYHDPCYQLQNDDSSCVGDLLYFLEDNPGAIQAVIDWTIDNFEDDIENDEEDYIEEDEEYEEVEYDEDGEPKEI